MTRGINGFQFFNIYLRRSQTRKFLEEDLNYMMKVDIVRDTDDRVVIDGALRRVSKMIHHTGSTEFVVYPGFY